MISLLFVIGLAGQSMGPADAATLLELMAIRSDRKGYGARYFTHLNEQRNIHAYRSSSKRRRVRRRQFNNVTRKE